jgi:hypothetical protein
MSDNEPTIAELFSRDPFQLSKLDIDRIITHMREARQQFKLTGKAQTAEKRPVDLQELGLL